MTYHGDLSDEQIIDENKHTYERNTIPYVVVSTGMGACVRIEFNDNNNKGE